MTKFNTASVEILFLSIRQLNTFIKILTGISVKIDIDFKFHMKMLRPLNSKKKKKKLRQTKLEVSCELIPRLPETGYQSSQ